MKVLRSVVHTSLGQSTETAKRQPGRDNLASPPGPHQATICSPDDPHMGLTADRRLGSLKAMVMQLHKRDAQ